MSKTHLDTRPGQWATEYRSWTQMKERCYNPNSKSYGRYGGRGITVCDSWRNSYESFILDMGRKPTSEHSIERVDNDGGYDPSNCRWATKKEQARNRRSSRCIEVQGQSKTLAEWAEVSGVNQGMIWKRLRRGWSPDRAVTL